MSVHAKRGAAALLVLFCALQLARPDRANPPVDESRTLYALTSTPPDVREILDRSCRDCHSNETRWPWYSALAPVGWLVADDVANGRERLNMSDWARYEESESKARLLWMAFAARGRTMPPASYLRMHPEARLSDRDVRILADWVDAITK